MMDLTNAQKRRRRKALYAALDQSVDVALNQADVSPEDRKKLKGILKWMMKDPHPFAKCKKALLAHGWSESRANKTCATLKDVATGTTKWRKGAKLSLGVSNEDLAEVTSYFSDFTEEELIAAFSDCGCSEPKSETPTVALLREGNSVVALTEHGQMTFTSPDENKLTAVRPDGEEIELSVPDEGQLRDIYDELRPSLELSENQDLTIEFMTDFTPVELAAGKDEGNGIWKPIIRTGRWRVGPWSTRDKQVPLNVVADGPSDPKKCLVSLEDLLASFEDGAKQHVTVPLAKEDDARTHKNYSIDNTGFIRKVKIEKDGKNGVLWGLFDFKDAEVRDKAMSGALADVSAGIKFDYERKRDGKRYRTMLDHVAITNDPWIDGMQPFGLSQSEERKEEVVYAVHSSGNPEEINTVRNSLTKFVRIRGNNKATPATNGVEVSATLSEHQGGDDVADDNEKTVITADEFVKTLGFETPEDLKEALGSVNDARADLHERDVRDTVRSWEEDGVPPAVIAAARPFLEQDDGGPAINLSTTVDGNDVEDQMTVTKVIKAVVAAIPDSSKVELSDRSPAQKDRANRPKDESDEDSLTEEQHEVYADAFLSGKSHAEALALALKDDSGNGEG